MPSVFETGLTADFLAGKQRLFSEEELVLLKSQGINYCFLERNESPLSGDLVGNIDALICLASRINADSLGRSGRLLAVLRFGVGYDTVDVAACTRAGVALFIAAGAVNHSVAEAILGWMLALGHHCFQKDRIVREGRWQEKSQWMGSELRGKVIGLLGLGGIGSTVAGLLKPFRVAEILACDPYTSGSDASALGVHLCSLDKLLGASDYVVICCPLNEETRGMIGPAELARMKPQAYLVNTARGGIVDEMALVEALKTRRLAGAAIDVFAEEPPPVRHPLFELDNVILAPHAIAWTHELFQEMSRMCCQQAIALAHGKIPAGLVNKEVCDQEGFRRKLNRWKS